MIGITRTDSGCAAVWIGGNHRRVGFWYRMPGQRGLLDVTRYTSGRTLVRFWRFAYCQTSDTWERERDKRKGGTR